MKKRNLFVLLLASIALIGCQNGTSSAVSSSSASTDEDSSSSSSLLSSSSSITTSSSYTGPAYSSSSVSSVVIPVGKAFTFGFDNADGLSSEGTIEKYGGYYKANDYEIASDAFLELNQGGQFSNINPVAAFESIKVDYEMLSAFGYLRYKGSSYSITSPENGSYDLPNDAVCTFDSTPGMTQYFSIYAPVGEFKIISITLIGHGADFVAPNESNTIDFYSVNDVHGACENSATDNPIQIGIDAMSQYFMTKQRANPESTVSLSSGDMWQGTADSNLTTGQLVTNWMNLVGFDSMAIGNHEFDWGISKIVENQALADFPFLGINIVDGSGNRPSWASPSKIIVRKGIRIGIVGAIGLLASSIATSSLGGYGFVNPVPLINAEADRLRNVEGCSIVVVSVHNGSLVGCDDHVDAVFEGHTHQDYDDTSSSVPHVQCSGNGSVIQHVALTKQNDGSYKCTIAESIGYSNAVSYGNDPTTASMYDYYLVNQINVIKTKVVGHSSSHLSKAAIGAQATQAMLEKYQAMPSYSNIVLASINTGGVRNTIPAGDITYGEVYQALPFDNDNTFCTISGVTLKSILTNGYNYSYPSDYDQSSIVSTAEYHIVDLSYTSESTSFGSEYNIYDRDSENRIRDIYADYLTAQMNG